MSIELQFCKTEKSRRSTAQCAYSYYRTICLKMVKTVKEIEKSEKQIHTHQEDSHVKMEVKTELCCHKLRNASNHQKLRERHGADSSLCPSERAWPTNSFWIFSIQNCNRINFYCFKSLQFVVFMFWQSWNLIQEAHRKELKMNAHSHAWSSQYSITLYSAILLLLLQPILRL